MQAIENDEKVSLTPANSQRVFTGHPVRPKRLDTTPKPVQITIPITVGLAVVAVIGLILRAALLNEQSAYMDETSYILTGRLLIEKHTPYLNSGNWTYGSYLWGLMTGVMDMLGGLVAVRTLTALLGAVMIFATGLTAYRLSSERFSNTQKWVVGVVAAVIFAVLPTAIGEGRFATYDAPAGAAFMLGISILAPFPSKPKKTALLLGAVLLFVAFLSKYIVAIYFPFVCLFLLFGRRNRVSFWRSAIYFVLPLSVLTFAYLALFRNELSTLLSYATSYTDLRSNNPIQEYVLQRPELWILAAIALFGIRRATSTGRIVGLGGTAIILAFQAISRPDFDFWKHSIYVIFFLAPLAALVLAPIVQFTLKWLSPTQFRLKRSRGLAISLSVLIGLIASVGLYFTMNSANNLVTFYPNLNPGLAAIRTNTAQSTNVLVDDIAVRYYLYPQLQPNQIFDAFYYNYRGKQGLPAYTQAISDRHFDTIILDGGIGPVEGNLRSQLDDVLSHYYKVVYSGEAGSNAVLEIYKPRSGPIEPLQNTNSGSNGTKVFNFDGSIHAWGGHSDTADQQPGSLVSISQEQTWQNNSTLEYKPSDTNSLVSVKYGAPVKTIKAEIYVASSDTYGAMAVPVGVVGFDSKWQWHDDGFKQSIPVGKWMEVTWNLPQPGVYNEIGFKFKEASGRKIYIGKVEVQP